MDQELLVTEQIDDGQRLIDQLAKDGFEVRAAYWVRTSESGSWTLQIATPPIPPDKLGTAYRTVYASLGKIINTWVSPSDIKLVNSTSLVALEAVRVRDRYPAKTPTWYRGKSLGPLAVEEAYIYPRPKKRLQGFDEIKQNFPSAEVFSIPVLATDDRLANYDHFMGKVNAEPFEGRAPETTMFMGLEASSGKPLGELVFIHRPEGWNTLFRADTGRYERVRHVQSNEPLYQAADFAPLADMRTEITASDQSIDMLKERLRQGWRMTLPPNKMQIDSIPFTTPPEFRATLPETVDWDFLRRFMEAGGRIEMRPQAKDSVAGV
jgi:hypothetical protein